MVKIQIDLDEAEDFAVDIYRAEHRLSSKEKAIKDILKKLKRNKK